MTTTLEAIELASIKAVSTRIWLDDCNRPLASPVWKVALATESGRANAFLKLLPAHQLISEAVCTLLGRAVGLDLPRGFLVEATPDTLPDADWQPGEAARLGFGSEDAEFQSFAFAIHHGSAAIERELMQWQGLAPLAFFDEWVANTDRHFRNLLYRGGEFIPIDHSHALTGHDWTPERLTPSATVVNQMLTFATRYLSEHQRFQWRRSAADCTAGYHRVPLDELAEYAELERYATPKQTLAVLDFLRRRIFHVPKLAAGKLGLPELDFWPHMKTHRAFPSPGAYRAQWAPVYLEPIIGSGERLTVGILVLGADGQRQVAPVLREDQVSTLWGEQGRGLLRSIDLCLNVLREHLSDGGDLDRWPAPFAGVCIGPLKPARGDDAIDVLRTGMSFSACFSTLEQGIEETAEDDDTEDPWPKQVHAAVQARVPSLSGNFNKQIKTATAARPTPVGYLSTRLAANLGKLIPGPRLGEFVKTAKVKALNLVIVRDLEPCQRQFELLIFRPREDDPSYTARQMKNLRGALLELKEAGNHHELRVVEVLDAAQAADRIIRAEAAA
ncbi:hypothetical protein C7443_101506 [Plasticicumulans acidivorans]|uniref:HipA-like kinase domain-containing protein n=2 Tax=Plasticicumulans acidivorans TaxID=886464 RepID=A0A317N2E7_9GAMM|nr:hypothetical protein C7443_101506 [Plasticicumulans acidivorans]